MTNTTTVQREPKASDTLGDLIADRCDWYKITDISAIKFAGIRQVYSFPRFSMVIAANHQ